MSTAQRQLFFSSGVTGSITGLCGYAIVTAMGGKRSLVFGQRSLEIRQGATQERVGGLSLQLLYGFDL